MAESRNFKELLLVLNDRLVEYLIVGGYAVMRYFEPRFTKHLDIWVGNALCHSTSPRQRFRRDFSVDQTVYQIGVPPVRVDALTSISGRVSPDAWGGRVPGVMYGVPVHFISLPDLIANKRAAGRTSDLEHLKLLDERS